MKNGRFTVKRVLVRNGPFTYHTHRLCGYLNGRRIRLQFKTAAEAAGKKNLLEVEAANAHREIRALNTRLAPEQLAEAEAAFHRLAGKSLSAAIDWFLMTHRPPVAPMPFSLAAEAFLAERSPHVSYSVARDYRLALKTLGAAFGGRDVHSIATEELLALMSRQPWGPKGWNNFRGYAAAFFEWCHAEPRRWLQANPVGPIRKNKIARGIPEILPAAKVAELFQYLETYAGGPRRRARPGCLVPYFALATFAGLRPAIPWGEIWKLGRLRDLSRVIDLQLGVIRIGPEIAKTKDLRQVTIQPNLRAWLEAYPLKRFPILPPNLQAMATAVRKQFSIGPDTLRRTFVSMHVAKWRSVADTSLQAGHSERVLRSHYLNLVSQAEAESFWKIEPSGATL